MTWPIRTIGSVCVPTTVRDPRDTPDDVFQYIDISSVDRDSKRISRVESILGSDAPSRARKLVAAEDVLVSTVRPNLNAVALLSPDLDGQVASTGFCVLRVEPRIIDPRFLFFFCRTPQFIETLSKKVKGAHYPAVSDGDVKSTSLPIPAPSEQRRIIELLDLADALRCLRAEADAKADRILPALFIKMFGDPATNPKGFDLVPLGNPKIGELDRGRSRHRPRNDPALLGGPHPLIQTGDVARCDGRIRSYTQTYSDLGLSQSKMWPAGTLCITIAANIAETGVLEFDACFPDSVVGFVPGPRATTEYVQGFLRHLQPVLERNAPQAAQKNINLEILRGLPCPLPPRDLQDQFSVQVREHYRARRRQIETRARLDSLFTNMAIRAFDGTLTISWRESHMKELIQEMEQQARYLAAPESPGVRA